MAGQSKEEPTGSGTPYSVRRTSLCSTARSSALMASATRAPDASSVARACEAFSSAVHSSGSGSTAAGGLGQQRQEAESRRAILSVPLQTRMLFAYAYFNVLWNKMASERVRRYGLQPVEGDCVIAAPEVGYGRGAAAAEVSEGSAAEPEQAEVPRSTIPPHRTA